MDRDAALAGRIAAQHGLPSAPATEVTGQGSVNHVVVVGPVTGRHVVRFAVDSARADEFATETWCARQAHVHGVPTAEVVANGRLDGVPYVIQRFVPGAVAGDGIRDRERVWHTLGRYARTINALPLTADAPDGLFSRFGRDLPAAWRAHLAYNLAELTADDPLIGLGVYPATDRVRLRETVLALGQVPLVLGLSHGDLALRNVLIGTDGRPVLLDWGSASCGPVPHTDLLVLLRDHEDGGSPGEGDLEAFASGYGVDLAAVRPVTEAIRDLTALDTVRWARDRRPDRLPDLVASARRRLRHGRSR